MSELTDEDQRALDRAVDLAALEPAEKARIDGRFEAGESWIDVAVDCARHLQRKNLELRPWESPPIYGDTEPKRDRHAFDLLQKLLSLGLSRFEPSPLTAIGQAEAKRVAPAR